MVSSKVDATGMRNGHNLYQHICSAFADLGADAWILMHMEHSEQSTRLNPEKPPSRASPTTLQVCSHISTLYSQPWENGRYSPSFSLVLAALMTKERHPCQAPQVAMLSNAWWDGRCHSPTLPPSHQFP